MSVAQHYRGGEREEREREGILFSNELERRRRAVWKLTRDYCVGAAPRQR